MSKSKRLSIIIISVLLVGIAGFAVWKNDQNSKELTSTEASQQASDELAAMKAKEAEAQAMEKEKMAKEATTNADEKVTMEKEEAMAKSGSYVTLADYNANPSKYADSKKIYFFHASWCPICQGIDKEITADPSKIPAGITIVKTDYDTSTALRQKYGVTYQYSFVQVDSGGNKTDKWSATSLADALAGIKS